MAELKRVDILTVAKMFAVLSFIAGIVVAIFAVAAISLLPSTALSSLNTVSQSSQSHLILFFSKLGDILLIVIPVLAVVFGFIIGALEAWLYNLIAERAGGAKLVLSNGVVQSFDPVSTAKIVALIAGVVSFVSIIIIALFTAFTSSGVSAILAVGLGIFGTVFVMIIEFIVIIVVVFVYNYVARKIGGIRVDIKSNVLRSVEPARFAKIYAIFTAILGLFYGILFTFIFSVAAVTGMHMQVLGVLGALSIIIFPILGFIFGFIYAAIYAIVYNWIAEKIGGIKLYIS